MDIKSEEKRILQAYQKRDQHRKPALYSWQQADSLWNEFRVKSRIARALKQKGYTDLSELNILDVGCGSGSWLRTLSEWGADPGRLHGIDLLPDRIEKAKILSPGFDLRQASGFDLPFEDDSMDLVLSFVVFSSILDPKARAALAGEMKRVLSSRGTIQVFDFKISHPGNPDTVAIGKSEIGRLFSGMKVSSKSLILAPPLSRRISSLSPLLTHLLESCCPFLRTHVLYLVGG